MRMLISGAILSDFVVVSSVLLIGQMDWATASVIVTIAVTLISALFGLFIKILSKNHVEHLKASITGSINVVEKSFKEEIARVKQEHFAVVQDIKADLHQLGARLDHLDAELDSRFDSLGEKVTECRLISERITVKMENLER